MTVGRLHRTIVFASAALIAVVMMACGEDVELGRAVPPQKPPPSLTPPDSGLLDAELPTDDPCKGKVCGDPCSPGGVVIHQEFRCDSTGACSDSTPLCDGG